MLAPSFFCGNRNKNYFWSGRRPKNRTLLGANVDFNGKPGAKRALLDVLLFVYQRPNTLD